MSHEDITTSSVDSPTQLFTEDDLSIECAVCLQPCIYPVQLPCKHIFCYLCVKGVTTQSKRCAMCRREIPEDYLINPELLSKVDIELEGGKGFEEGGECWQWFYEGRNGWWVYDERTSQEIETHFKNDKKRCELLIAGFLYIIDFEHMLQYRRNDPSRRRKIKRDVSSRPKKGVAGLRIEQELEASASNQDNGGSQQVNDDEGLADAIGSLSIVPGISGGNNPDHNVSREDTGETEISRSTNPIDDDSHRVRRRNERES